MYCPVCQKKMIRKYLIPNENITGKFIDVLIPIEVCGECNSHLKNLSVSSKSGSSASIAKSKRYFNNLISDIDDVNLAAILDLYVNYEEKNIIETIVGTAYDEYLRRLEEYKSYYLNMDHVFTSSGALGTKEDMCYFTPYLELPRAKDIFTRDAEDIFYSKLESYPENWHENIVSYAIVETKRELIGDDSDVISIKRKNIIYYKGEEKHVCVKYLDNTGNFTDCQLPLVYLEAFNKLIPEKEFSKYQQIVDELESKAMAELTSDFEIEPEINSTLDISQESVPIVDEDLAKIKQLKELLDLGAISKTEYNKKKKQLLGLDK